MAKVTFDTALCKGCGLCVNACPKGLVSLSDADINPKGYRPAQVKEQDKCTGCACCALMCPDCVITVERE